MRLRLINGRIEVAVVEVHSQTEFIERFTLLEKVLKDRLEEGARLEIHLWHGDAWWNLSEDLTHFFAWKVDMDQSISDETRRFVFVPLSRLDWLYEAAEQMQRLLDAASTVRPALARRREAPIVDH